MRFRCPNCNAGIELDDRPLAAVEETVSDVVVCPSCNSQFDFSGDDTETAIPFSGQSIAHFEIREKIGEGAFGHVLGAYDTELERTVAIKIPRDHRMNATALKAFFKEARAASTIQHPNVITVYEVGTADNVPYIVTEFIDGVSLSEWLKTNELTAGQAVDLMVTICDAVHAAHQQNVIHRDLKPGNIILDRQLQPHVGDFGLARREGTTDLTVTQNGKVFGTPAYMSPEQARGRVDLIRETSDVYSLGVCLYQLLTGRRPFRATDSRTVMYQIITQDPTPPRRIRSDVHRDLDTICLKALEKLPSNRYASAGEMADDLRRYQNDRAILARPVSRIETAVRWGRRNRMLAALSGLLLLFVSVVVLLLNQDTASVAKNTTPMGIRCELPAGIDTTSVNWAFVLLDEDREPDSASVTRLTDAGPEVVTDLEPGEYLIVVNVPGVGFHEVYRRIPDDLNRESFSLSPTRFDVIDDRAWLTPISILPTDDVVALLTKVKGGDYLAGNDNPRDIFSPLTNFDVADFYVQSTEVTYDNYTSVMPEPPIYLKQNPPPQGDHPVVGVHWYMAAHYAETIGCRLLTEIEWEYAATNGGTTPFPSTVKEEAAERLKLKPVTSSTKDMTPDTGIQGLMSNAAEITSSKLTPFGSGTMLESSVQLVADSFVYKGGPATRQSAEKGVDPPLKSRMCLQSRRHTGDFLSFRCGKSASPRFLTP